MAERRVNVGWAEGLHARPASIFVRAATATGVPVTIAKADGSPVNAASMLAVLGLGAQGGEEIVPPPTPRVRTPPWTGWRSWSPRGSRNSPRPSEQRDTKAPARNTGRASCFLFPLPPFYGQQGSRK